MSSISEQLLRLHTRQCSVTPRNVTQQFLRQNTSDFIAADEWVSYSPDLIPLDYCIWDILQDLMYEGQRLPFANLQDLKKAIKNICKVTIETVRKSIKQRKKTTDY